MSGRVSMVTLGVRDLAKSTEFYQALGWELSSSSVPGEVSFFKSEGALLGLWGHHALAADAGLPPGPQPAFRGAANAVNLESREAVDALLALALEAGAMIPRPAVATDWGGYNGYFMDPDGHLWEVAHNPFWPIGPDGRPELPD